MPIDEKATRPDDGKRRRDKVRIKRRRRFFNLKEKGIDFILNRRNEFPNQCAKRAKQQDTSHQFEAGEELLLVLFWVSLCFQSTLDVVYFLPGS